MRVGTPTAVMIFAAGLGTRLGALTLDRPKALVEVAGRPLIGHALELARDAGADPVVVNIHAHADLMRTYLAKAAPEALISHEPDLLDTGGGLRQALPLLGQGPVFTLNADVIWSGLNPLTTLRAQWDPDRMDALLAIVSGVAAAGHTGKGDFDLGAGGHLTRRTAAVAGYVYAGAQIIAPSALGAFAGARFSLNAVWEELAGRDRLYGVVHSGGWIDAGSPEGVAHANAAFGS